MHFYRFADPAHEIVQRDDGRSFHWPRGESISNVKDARLPQGSTDDDRIVECYRRDGGPNITAPYKPEPGRALTVLAAALGGDDAVAADAVARLWAAGYVIMDRPRPCR
jgi:hypothetical protein